MSEMPSTNHFCFSAPAPRAQFFAIRAMAHNLSLSSFEEITTQQILECFVSGNPAAQERQLSK